jgi:hypothetical protein
MGWWTTEVPRRIKWAGGLNMLVEIAVFMDKYKFTVASHELIMH